MDVFMVWFLFNISLLVTLAYHRNRQKKADLNFVITIGLIFNGLGFIGTCLLIAI